MIFSREKKTNSSDMLNESLSIGTFSALAIPAAL